MILGGPGAGKTWLARRIARHHAEKALKALDAGIGLDEVELPLLHDRLPPDAGHRRRHP